MTDEVVTEYHNRLLELSRPTDNQSRDPARAYIDDRALRFTTWPDIERYFR